MTHGLSTLVLELQQPQLAASLQRARQIPEHSLFLILIIVVFLRLHIAGADGSILVHNLNSRHGG